MIQDKNGPVFIFDPNTDFVHVEAAVSLSEDFKEATKWVQVFQLLKKKSDHRMGIGNPKKTTVTLMKSIKPSHIHEFLMGKGFSDDNPLRHKRMCSVFYPGRFQKWLLAETYKK